MWTLDIISAFEYHINSHSHSVVYRFVKSRRLHNRMRISFLTLTLILMASILLNKCSCRGLLPHGIYRSCLCSIKILFHMLHADCLWCQTITCGLNVPITYVCFCREYRSALLSGVEKSLPKSSPTRAIFDPNQSETRHCDQEQKIVSTRGNHYSCVAMLLCQTNKILQCMSSLLARSWWNAPACTGHKKIWYCILTLRTWKEGGAVSEHKVFASCDQCWTHS